MDYLIRNAMDADAPAISRVIIGTLRGSNAQDYSSEVINQVEQSFLQRVAERRITFMWRVIMATDWMQLLTQYRPL